jgi:hypothetical protein
MRVLFLTHYFPPEGNAPATRVHAMTTRWAAAGHEVHVVTGTPNVPHGDPMPVTETRGGGPRRSAASTCTVSGRTLRPTSGPGDGP